MPTLIEAFPDIPRHTVDVELDGDSYLIRFEWRQVQEAWYFSLFDENETPLVYSKRLTPGQMPLSNINAGPPGEILIRGPANYDRKTLGRELQVKYYSADEVIDREQRLPVEVY